MTDRIPGVMADTCVRLFGRGEAFDSEGFVSFFTDTPMYQFGNGEPCFTKAAIRDSVAGFFASVDALYHDVRNVWELGDVVFVEMDVIYWRKDGTSVVLPCSDILRFDGPKIQELRIFEDANPLFDAGLPVGPRASVFTQSEGRRAMAPGVMRRYFTEHAEGIHRADQRLPAEVVARRPALADASQDGHPGRAPGRHRRGRLGRSAHRTSPIAPCCGLATGRRSFGPQAILETLASVFLQRPAAHERLPTPACGSPTTCSSSKCGAGGPRE